MTSNFQNISGFELFRKLNILFYAILGSIFLFFIVAIIAADFERSVASPQFGPIAEYVIVALIIISISASYSIYIIGAKRIEEQTPLSEKIRKFYLYSLIKLAMFELACIFALFGYIITAMPLYLAIGFVIVIILFLHKPTPKKLVVEFKLTKDEKEYILSGKPAE